MAQDYGSRIRKLRDAKQLTIEELAGKAGITAGYLGRLERGESGYDNPTLATIEAIARALELHPAVILFGKILSPEIELNHSGNIIVSDNVEKRFITKFRKLTGKLERNSIEKIMDAFIELQKAP
ncbi:MAG: helix-turn-helix transcriptional regulator [Deltaproteobacteria bacterium]|nr:helix-turn-helix transcriptional regulator [Deltaproteobacteria bacterium]